MYLFAIIIHSMYSWAETTVLIILPWAETTVVSFGRDTKTVGPFYLVPMPGPGEVKDPTWG